MRSAIRQLSALAAILAAGVIVSTNLAAQQSADPNAAEQLEARASHPNARAADWIDSGNLLVQAAGLRSVTDPRALEDLIGAASAYRVAGKLTLARRTALQAATRSLRARDADRAAHAYLAAADLSFALRDEEGARTYLERAARQGDSPRLTMEQKRTLLAQLMEARGRVNR